MLSVIVPIYNEEQLLEQSVLKIHSYLESKNIIHEIIVVSNGSKDKSCEIASEMLKRYQPWFKFAQIEERGVGRAFKHAVRLAQYEYLVSLDIDLPADLVFLDYAQQLLPYTDMLVGSKSMGNQSRALLRILGSQLYILIAQLLFRLTISDYAPSTKAYRRSAVLPVLESLDPWTGYVFELCVVFRIHGKRVIQIGVDCYDRRKSKFNLLHEGFYRYLHLFNCFRNKMDKSSWFYR